MVGLMADSKGDAADALKRAMKERGWNQSQLGRELEKLGPGGGVGTVNKWITRDRIPSFRSALAIQELLGIPADSWLSVKRRRRRRAVERAERAAS